MQDTILQKIAIFGSTGSIGVSTLEVIDLHLDKYQVFALSGNNNLDLLAKQCAKYHPKFVYIPNVEMISLLRGKLDSLHCSHIQILCGKHELIDLASNPEIDVVMSAIVGSAGLIPTYYAAKTGKKILLANKESLVAAGKLITTTAKEHSAQIIPVDSEHSAIYQALPYGYSSLKDAGVNKIILTASGGPFLNTPKNEIANKLASEAIKHPNWSMGRKISVDSATLMNKGLEVIEAHWLFDTAPNQIEVVVHPQSIIHSMVEYVDSSIIAQLGTPDMKTPIAYALSAPNRIISGSNKLDFLKLKELTFESPDLERFPCLQLAFDSLESTKNTSAIINAANEIAVEKYLNDEIKFYDIPLLIEKALIKYDDSLTYTTLEDILALDYEVKQWLSDYKI